ncbi:MAG: hypothetical protein OHK0029_07630 [Armatimonadaceae bacterium]
MLRSVRARMTLWNVGVVALALGILGVVLRLSVEENLRRGLDRELRERTEMPMPGEFRGRGGPGGGTGVRGGFGRPHDQWEGRVPGGPGRPGSPGGPEGMGPPGEPGGPNRMFPPNPPGFPGSPFRQPPRLISREGKDLFTGKSTVPWSKNALAESLQGKAVYTEETLGAERVRVFSRPLRREGEVIGAVQVAAPLAEIERAVQGIQRTMLLLLPVALLIAGAGGGLLTERALRPVRDLTAAAQGIRATNLAARLPVSGGDEFARLSGVLNGMLQRLEEAFHRERRFAADASHELKTPLAIIKANTSLQLDDDDLPADYRKTLSTIDRATDRANRIVQDLLLLAREGSGALGLRREPIPVEALFREVQEAVGSTAGRVVWQPVPGLTVSGDRHHLIRLLTNLLENALRHTPEEGDVFVSAKATGDSTVVLEVRDTGSGIPAEHLPHVLEPFYRIDAARTRDNGGSGLGLAICQSIARAHGGSLEITSEEGKGTTVTVRLPRTEPETG